MKKFSNLFTSILFAGLMLIITVPANAQFCGGTDTDPELTSQMGPLAPTVTSFFSGQFLAQTFTATQMNCTGASVIVPAGFGPGTYTISLIEGAPNAPGATLAVGAAPVAAGGGTAQANWPQVTVVPGNVYHILIESNEFTLGFFTTTSPVDDEYVGGEVWFIPLFGQPFDIYFEIEYCSNVIVPTMGQWGLIFFALLLLSFGTVQVLNRETVLAGANSGSSSNFKLPILGSLPFDFALYTKGLIFAAFAFIAIFSFAIAGFGYEWMQADFAGILFTLPVTAYLFHLLLMNKEA